ncbi:hypothetical protein ES288_A09G054500v1 [Gossypium darwinii]|uniref:Uncharacterized protein n=2 Tax=Gossypium TaxID=3633 RepID=A0A5D2P0E1_GOSTO|nr:hypothetical protein ES288_A09G054500v1 [Gossypium darwinii]TYI09163.1 hypothetical protein ES332_A09G051700v1 [Gossypium tomentosum]
MGCGISRSKISQEGTAPAGRHFRIVHRKNDERAVADSVFLLSSKPLVQGENHAKADHKMVNSERKEGPESERVENEHKDDDDEEEDGHERDETMLCSPSPSFKDFCTTSSHHDDDNTRGYDNTEQIKARQQCDVENYNKKGSSGGLRKRGRITKGIKNTVQHKFKVF